MGVRNLCAAVAISVAALACLLALPSPSGPDEAQSRMMAFVVDRPITTYPEYLELIIDGEVDIVRDGITVHLVKSELGWHYLQRLSILVCAE